MIGGREHQREDQDAPCRGRGGESEREEKVIGGRMETMGQDTRL